MSPEQLVASFGPVIACTFCSYKTSRPWLPDLDFGQVYCLLAATGLGQERHCGLGKGGRTWD